MSDGPKICIKDAQRQVAERLSKPRIPEPWGYPLWKHLVDEHELVLTESELYEIVRLARLLP